jgi:hypothetical protein
MSTSTDDLFVPSTTIDPNKDYSQDLVGEGKKFADIPSLARGKVESDLHIARLEREAELLRQDLSRRTAIEAAKEQLKLDATTTTQSNEGNTSADGHDQRAQIKPEDISKLVQSEISRISSENKERSNVQSVQARLTEAWGPDYVTTLEAKANELGYTKEWLTEIAKTQPKAFLTLVGADTAPAKQAPSSLFSPSQAGISTAALSSSTKGNLPQEETYAYWKKVRKENPKYYDSVDGTMARHKAAIKQGEAFYG